MSDEYSITLVDETMKFDLIDHIKEMYSNGKWKYHRFFLPKYGWIGYVFIRRNK